MKKIILLEDREPRQRIFLEESKIQLDELKKNIDMKTGEESKNIFKKIGENGKAIFDILKNYEVVIAHKSGLIENRIYNHLMDYFSKNNNKRLVIFSGGISDSVYTEKPFACLQINSKNIYSTNLLEYSKNLDLDINYLAYGKKWKVNYMVRLANLYQLKSYKELDISDEEITKLEKLCESNVNNITENIKTELGI